MNGAGLRRWGWIALTVVLMLVFARLCVRIVPADMPVGESPLSLSEATGREGGPAAGGALLIPVEGVRADALVDTYIQSRAEGQRAHDAIDIVAERGAPVLAAADGWVEKLFWSQDGGRTLYERSVDGRTLYYYAHLDSYEPGLREGARLSRGQRIATVGSTGNADPAVPHLHFAVHRVAPEDRWYEGRAVNPYPLLARGR